MANNLLLCAVNNIVDYAWEHGRRTFKDNKPYVECKYCGHLVKGINRLKYHLAQQKGIVKVCALVPQSISDGFRANFEEDPIRGNMRLKVHQNRVPPVEIIFPILQGNSSEPRSSESLETVIQSVENRQKEVDSGKELGKKRKRDAGESNWNANYGVCTCLLLKSGPCMNY